MLNLKDKTLTVTRKMERMNFSKTVTGEADPTTAFYFSYDDKFLYFRFECTEDFMIARHTEYNAPLYDGDIVELLISLGEKTKYFEVEVNQNNAQYGVFINNKDGKEAIEITKYDKNIIHSTVKVGENRWTCDIILSMEDLVNVGWTAQNFHFNAHRQRFRPDGSMDQLSLSPGYEQYHYNFHNTTAFLKVSFE